MNDEPRCRHCDRTIREHPAALPVEEVTGGHPDDARCLDKWIHAAIFRKDYLKPDTGLTLPRGVLMPDYSTTWDGMMLVVREIQEWVSWRGADGFFHLSFGEFADHNMLDDYDCLPEEEWDPSLDGLDVDPVPWSAHIHAWMVADTGVAPAHWDHADTFCARGETAPLAVCRAAILAIT